jgi:hypothetical protein
LLINSRASVNIRDRGGYTALDLGIFNFLKYIYLFYNIYFKAYLFGNNANIRSIIEGAGGVRNNYGK